jgi:hypothetical protein
MITDGWVLPDKEMPYDPRFDLIGCLAAFHSFLRNYRCGGKPFDIFMRDECKAHNVNVRVILPFLQMGSGLLSRKQEPGPGAMKRAVLLPDRGAIVGGSFEGQIVNCVSSFRKFYEKADLVEPYQCHDGVALAKSRTSYAVLAYVGRLGQAGYPDSGCHLYLRHFNQLGRFSKWVVGK